MKGIYYKQGFLNEQTLCATVIDEEASGALVALANKDTQNEPYEIIEGAHTDQRTNHMVIVDSYRVVDVAQVEKVWLVEYIVAHANKAYGSIRYKMQSTRVNSQKPEMYYRLFRREEPVGLVEQRHASTMNEVAKKLASKGFSYFLGMGLHQLTPNKSEFFPFYKDQVDGPVAWIMTEATRTEMILVGNTAVQKTTYAKQQEMPPPEKKSVTSEPLWIRVANEERQGCGYVADTAYGRLFFGLAQRGYVNTGSKHTYEQSKDTIIVNSITHSKPVYDTESKELVARIYPDYQVQKDLVAFANKASVMAHRYKIIEDVNFTVENDTLAIKEKTTMSDPAATRKMALAHITSLITHLETVKEALDEKEEPAKPTLYYLMTGEGFRDLAMMHSHLSALDNGDDWESY